MTLRDECPSFFVKLAPFSLGSIGASGDAVSQTRPSCERAARRREGPSISADRSALSGMRENEVVLLFPLPVTNSVCRVTKSN